MTRLRAAMFALTLAATPVAAQVGFTPDQSPYRDLPWKQSVGGFAGGLATATDPAGVGPQPGWLTGVRYDLRLGGPVSLTGRLAMGPTTRRVLDPTKPASTRHVGDQSGELMAVDLGFSFNLTGQKSYRRLVPLVATGVGIASDFHGTPDDGGYRFGTRMLMYFGLGMRYHTDGRWEQRVDFTNYLWQMQYPPDYTVKPSDNSAAILVKKKSPWLGNHLWSVGLSYQLFR